MSIFDLDEPKKRTPISKAEWDAKKKMMGNKCVLCGQTEKRVGGLEKAHIKAHSRDGTQYVPMCANCHKKYDRNLLTDPELKKLGLTKLLEGSGIW
ncbi:MAG: hypothetical protein V3S51_00415 [Dehalococcoidia bacterium]